MAQQNAQICCGTVVTRLTAPGVAAIGVIGVAGPEAVSLVSSYFRPAGQNKLSSAVSSTIVQNILTNPACLQKQVLVGWFDDGQQRDQVVVLIQPSRPCEIVEIHCHGGPAVMQWIVETLRSKGARHVDVSEWLQLTIDNPIQRAALAKLQSAATTKTAAILLDQLHSAWERCIKHLEALLAASRWSEATVLVARLRQLIAVGKHLCRPFHIALAGAPNSGKSTLLNALLGYTRAITSPQPGTTRDIVTAETAFRGWPIRILDTAGFRDTDDPFEAAGIARAVHTWEQADLVLWLIDVSALPVLPPPELSRCLLVLSKVDLEFAWRVDEVLPASKNYVAVSARTGAGLENLIDTILQHLIPQIPQSGEAVPFTDALCATVAHLHQALGKRAWEQANLLVSHLYDPGPDLKTVD